MPLSGLSKYSHCSCLVVLIDTKLLMTSVQLRNKLVQLVCVDGGGERERQKKKRFIKETISVFSAIAWQRFPQDISALKITSLLKHFCLLFCPITSLAMGAK